MNEQKTVTLKEARFAIGCGEKFLRAEITRGAIAVRRVNARVILVYLNSLNGYIESRRTANRLNSGTAANCAARSRCFTLTRRSDTDMSANTEDFRLQYDAPPTHGRSYPLSVSSGWPFLAVSWGGGTNSTAMLCGLVERGIKPDLVMFADTGSEMPQTYKHLAMMQAQVQAWWGIELHVVRKLRDGQFEGLENECLRGAKLPALAYGSRACSVKYKHEPQNRMMKARMKERGIKVGVRAIGFDAGESHRVKPSQDKWAQNWYPLVEWGWRRAECVETIRRHGLPQPGKSACFFCPASKRGEVLRMREEQPELLARALEIERRAQTGANKQTRGLGGERNLWADWLAMDGAQAKLWDDVEPMHAPCGCYDGGGDFSSANDADEPRR